MIQPPLQPDPAGKGKIHEKLRELRKVALAARAVGRGVSYGPLGTSIRPPRRQASSPRGSGAVWL